VFVCELWPGRTELDAAQGDSIAAKWMADHKGKKPKYHKLKPRIKSAILAALI
jgi:hypothetical protein